MEDYEDHENYDAYLDKFEYRDQHIDLLRYYISSFSKTRKSLKKYIALYDKLPDLKVYRGIQAALWQFDDDTLHKIPQDGEIGVVKHFCCENCFYYFNVSNPTDSWARLALNEALVYNNSLREFTNRKLGKLLSVLAKELKPLLAQQKADLELYFGHNNSRV